MSQRQAIQRDVAKAEIPALTVGEAMLSALSNVLETMFFAEVTAVDEGNYIRPEEALACQVDCTGAHTGSFGVIVDRSAHEVLCCGFYGEDQGDVTELQMLDLICELTNMLAGSALGLYTPEHLCKLSSPALCGSELGHTRSPRCEQSRCTVALDGGHLTLWCSLQVAA